MARTRTYAGNTTALVAARAAFGVGGAYATISAYWGLGGTALGDTVGGALEHEVRSGAAGGLIIVWAAAVVKLIAALLPLAAIGLVSFPAHRWARRLSWIEAAILTVYGLVLTAVGLLVQADVVAASPHADHRALAWHAFLWDPWFLAWGVLVTIAMVASRPRTRPTAHARASAADPDREWPPVSDTAR